MILYTATISTPLGNMVAITDEQQVYLLEFADCQNLPRKKARVLSETSNRMQEDFSPPIQSLQQELNAYFSGTLRQFHTPLCIIGTEFQKNAWAALRQIPYGHVISYANQAIAAGNSRAVRAVASTNGANRLSIMVPCHRVLRTGGALGGYTSGCARKQWLINHEQKVLQNG